MSPTPVAAAMNSGGGMGTANSIVGGQMPRGGRISPINANDSSDSEGEDQCGIVGEEEGQVNLLF
jgi:hypothetical protein